MMHIRWTDDGFRSFKRIVNFIALENEPVAARTAADILAEILTLAVMPHRGRLGPKPGTRQLVLPKSGHIISYEVIGDGVFILDVYHASQDRPYRT